MYYPRCFLYAGLARLGSAAIYEIQDIYNSSNWASAFTFDTVRCLIFYLDSS